MFPPSDVDKPKPDEQIPVYRLYKRRFAGLLGFVRHMPSSFTPAHRVPRFYLASSQACPGHGLGPYQMTVRMHPGYEHIY